MPVTLLNREKWQWWIISVISSASPGSLHLPERLLGDMRTGEMEGVRDEEYGLCRSLSIVEDEATKWYCDHPSCNIKHCDSSQQIRHTVLGIREYFPLLFFFFFLNYLYTSRLLSFSCHWVANTLTGAGFDLLTVPKHQNNQNAESSVK